MFFLLLALLVGAIFASSFLKEPRRYANAILLAFALLFAFIGFAQLGQGTIFEGLSLLIAFLFIPLAIFLVGTVFIIAGFQALRREGISIPQMLSIGFGSALILAEVAIYAVVVFRLSSWQYIALYYYIFMALYVIFSFFALWIYSLLYLGTPRDKDIDFVIIHGAGLLNGEKVTPLLAGRADKARQVFDKLESPNKKIIASGGQGPDEKISEAQAIQNYLVEQGVNPADILLEDQSTTTYENLLFSKKMMDKRKPDYKAIFVTNDYHVFRTSLYARRLGMKQAQGVGCRTAFYYWPNAFIREYIAIIIKLKWIPIVISLIWLLAAFSSYS